MISTPGSSATSIGRAGAAPRDPRFAVADPAHTDVTATAATSTIANAS